ncbi:hypothetical protein PPACK8108_LOCUS9881, partial [Phakopsora pachyrhizi]
MIMEGILTSFETRSGSLGGRQLCEQHPLTRGLTAEQVGSKTAKTVHSKVKMTGVLEIGGYNLNVHNLPEPRREDGVVESGRSAGGMSCP